MNGFVLDVWGDLACFTRPEAKVERLSYPVMTPSAARGFLDAIFCKPLEFGWRIEKIEVLKPIRYIALRRNEVKERVRVTAVTRAMSGGPAPVIVADATRESAGTDQEGRTQRQTMALKDVKYRVHARIKPRRGQEARIRAFEDQARRRIMSGKCFYQPYLGCREFPGFFRVADGPATPVDETVDLGYMLYDVFDLDRVDIGNAKPYISLFRARLENGVLTVPDWDGASVLKPTREAR